MKKAKAVRRVIALILCAVFISLPLCSCRGKSKNINWLLSTAPKNLDPQTANDESELLIIKNCFTGLFEKNADGELFSSYVESYDISKSGDTYIFHLYKDKYWSIYEKGNTKKYAPVTAHDFEFAIRRVFSDDPNCDIMNVLLSIKGAKKAVEERDFSALGVSCPDDYTLKLELEGKNPAIIEAFSHHRLFPCNEQFFASTSGRYGLSYDLMLFNGSFVVSSFGESSVKLIKNANAPYEVSASGVTLYLPKATREHVALLEKGDIDAADLSFEKMELIKNSPDFTFSESSDCVWALIFNESDALWQNENLRNAVLTCSDRTVFETQSEHISPANRLFSKSTRIFSKNYLSLTKNVSTPKFNTETAKTLYAAALLELEMAKIYNTTVLVADSQIYKDSFSALNQVFQRELSLYFSPQYLAEGELIKRVKSGDFSAAVIPLYITGDTPFSILEYFYKSSAVCILPIENEDFINSFTLAQGISDASGAKHYGEAEAALYKSGIVNPLFFENSYFVTSNSVSGFLKDQYGSVLFKNVVKK